MYGKKNLLEQIKLRFDEEYDNILQFMNLLCQASSIPSWQVASYEYQILVDYRYFNSDNQQVYKSLYESDPRGYLELLKKKIPFIKEDLQENIDFVNNIGLDKFHKYDFDFIIDMARGWLENGYLDDINARISKANNISICVELVKKELDKLISIILDIYDNDKEEAAVALINNNRETMVNILLSDVYNNHILELRNLLDYIDKFEMYVKLNSEGHSINVYRQGFILVVVSFDAIMFDMARFLLEHAFFQYISMFHDDKSIKLNTEDLKDCKSFNGLKSQIINKSLSGKYIKKIIEKFKDVGVSYIDDNYKELIECMDRRNVHLHNQGIADRNYIDGMNIFGYSLGDVLPIDIDYYDNTFTLCSEAINAIHDWISSLL